MKTLREQLEEEGMKTLREQLEEASKVERSLRDFRDGLIKVKPFGVAFKEVREQGVCAAGCAMCGSPAPPVKDDLCRGCREDSVRQKAEIAELMEAGCSYHCAAGQVFGGQPCVLTVGGKHTPWHTMNPPPEPIPLRASDVAVPAVDIDQLLVEAFVDELLEGK